MVKDKKFTGILMSTYMMVANLGGQKDTTRRTRGLDTVNKNPDRWEYWRFFDGHAKFAEMGNSLNEIYVKCPYGGPGDILWFRETWQQESVRTEEQNGFVGYEATGNYVYKADGIELPPKNETIAYSKWRPSIHMPMHVCRMKAEIISVSVERVQDITNVAALDEGVLALPNNFIAKAFPDFWCRYTEWQAGKDGDIIERPPLGPSPKSIFKALIISLNSIEMWDKNLWVWVIKYKIL